MFQRKRENKSETEIVEEARQNVRRTERWGRWCALVCWATVALMVTMLVCLAIVVGQAINGFAQAGQHLEFLLGGVAGFVIGVGLMKIMLDIAAAGLISLPNARDRLLLQYHDALAKIMGEHLAQHKS
jgi:zinc transporter ZupT